MSPHDPSCKRLGYPQDGDFGRWWTFRTLGPTGSSTGFQHLLHSLLRSCSTILFPAKVYCFITCMPITAGTSKAMSQNVHFPPIGPSHQFCNFDKKLIQGHYQRSSVYIILAQSKSLLTASIDSFAMKHSLFAISEPTCLHLPHVLVHSTVGS